MSEIVVVLGTGSIGMRHLNVLRRMSGVYPMAVPKRAERVGELRETGIDAVNDIVSAVRRGAKRCIIATDTSRHAADAFLAAEHALDLLVEKPLTTDAPSARELCAHAAQRGARVFAGCVLRFSDSLNLFRKVLNRIGRVHSVRIESLSYLPDWRPIRPYKDSYSGRTGEGGAVRDLVHEIDYAGWLFGWPTAVQAKVRNLGRLGIQADEAADLTWERPDGCVISMSLDYLSRPSRRYMRASGEWGTLECDGIGGVVTLALAREPVEVMRSMQTRDEMLLAQDRSFIESSRVYHDPCLATGEDGVRALAVCDAAQRASDSRRQEKVDYP